MSVIAEPTLKAIDKETLRQVYSEYARSRSSIKCEAMTCFKYKGILGITDEQIDQTQIRKGKGSTQLNISRQKIIKAVTMVMRAEINKLAIDQHTIAIGEPLPQVGSWVRDSNLIHITPQGMYRYGKNSSDWLDPLDNQDFCYEVIRKAA